MSNYQRLISYIYAYEGGIKGKNIGFAKLDTRGAQCRIMVNVKRIYVGGNPIGVYLLAGEKEIRIGTLFARNGAGEFRAVVNAQNVEGSGLSMEECFGLTVHDTESAWRCYTTIWEDAVTRAAELDLQEVTAEQVRRAEEKKNAAKDAEQEAKISEEPLLISKEIEKEVEKEELKELGILKIREKTPRARELLFFGMMPPKERPVSEELPEMDEGAVSEAPPETEEQLISQEAPEQEEETVLREAPEQEEEMVLQEEAEQEEEMVLQEEAEQEEEMVLQEEAEQEEEMVLQEEPEQEEEMVLQEEAKQEKEMVLQEEPEQEKEMEFREPSQSLTVSEAAPVLEPETQGNAPASFIPSPHRREEEQKSEAEVWEMLRSRYPKIFAFDYEDGCEILTIKPQDIGLLPRENWIYGSNSFLLHGYYYYRYLILARLNQPGQQGRYLLGVPGHYMSNEKYMAAMFGFKDFVLSKRQPPKDSRFGYWYTDIKIT